VATAGDRRGPGPERAYAPDLPSGVGEVVLSPEESHHLVRVRRVRPEDPVVLFDGAGGSVLGQLVEAVPGRAVVAVEGPYPDREPTRPLVLAVSLPEPGRSDDLVASLAELGVARLVPLLAARTPRGRDALPARRRERWGRIAREAAKVNGCSRLLRIEPVARFDAVVAEAPAACVLDPDPEVPRLASVLPAHGDLPWLLVGPEGGFTDDEVASAERAGALRVRLGPLALRTSTAAIAAAALTLGS